MHDVWGCACTFQVEAALAGRLEAGLKAWTQTLLGQGQSGSDNTMDTDEPQKQAHKPGGDPHIKVLHKNFTKEKGSW